jgi:hypothetical protein
MSFSQSIGRTMRKDSFTCARAVPIPLSFLRCTECPVTTNPDTFIAPDRPREKYFMALSLMKTNGMRTANPRLALIRATVTSPSIHARQPSCPGGSLANPRSGKPYCPGTGRTFVAHPPRSDESPSLKVLVKPEEVQARGCERAKRLYFRVLEVFMSKLIYEEISNKVLTAAFTVHSALGPCQ